jgi:CRISPR-associated protein Cmr6
MAIPISRKLRDLDLKGNDLNPSLFYGKFAQWEPDESDDEKKRGYKDTHINRLIGLKGWSTKAKDLVKYLHDGAKTFQMQTETRLLIGRGTPAVFEQGISLHPLFGLPFLPGSAIKGVTVHWAAENGEDAELREQIFGPPPPDGKENELSQGKVVFLDAVPLPLQRQQCLEKDVLAPHYQNYYGDKKNSLWPSDEENVIPMFLPAVKREVVFQFAVQLAVAAKGEEYYLDCAAMWIECALKNFGIGSKTGSNYGYFKTASGAAEEAEIKQHGGRK